MDNDDVIITVTQITTFDGISSLSESTITSNMSCRSFIIRERKDLQCLYESNDDDQEREKREGAQTLAPKNLSTSMMK